LVALIGAMLSRIILVEWDTTESTMAGLVAMQRASQAMVVAEKVSFERGPTNGVLGDADQPDPLKRQRLHSVRQSSDNAIRELVAALEQEKASRDGDAAQAMREAMGKLAAARREVDRVAALPRSKRTPELLMGSVNQMFDVIPEIMRAVTLLSKEATDIYPQFADAMVGARLAAELREYAGRLGSQFTAALTEQKPLQETERQNIAFVRGRIEQLHHLILLETQKRDNDPRILDAVRVIEDRYFQSGLGFAASVERTGTEGRPYGMDTAGFAARYVPDMTSIIQLRDALVSVALEGARGRHADARKVLLMGLTVGGFALLVTVLLLLVIRQRVVTPLLAATGVIVEISKGKLDTEVPEAVHQDEIGDMLRAVTTLKENGIAKRRLEDERQGMINELEMKNRELQFSNAELEQFSYVASHDLRQPLRSITGYLGLIRKKLGPQLDEETTTFLNFAINGAKRMDQLILALLEYSRTGKAAEQTLMSLVEVVAEARTNLAQAIAEAEAAIVVQEGLPTVMGDRIELTRLFQNLLGNAIKYRAPGRPSRVEIGCRHQDREWMLWVRDNGIGIAPEDHERAFGIFQRLVTKTQYEGTGIGLAVCKKIVEHYGGRIWIESAAGDGATFFFTLQDGCAAS
jgi:signal transduction histidine kinase